MTHASQSRARRWAGRMAGVGAAATLTAGLFSGVASAADNSYWATYSTLSGCRAEGAYLVAHSIAASWHCEHETSTYYSLWYTPI